VRAPAVLAGLFPTLNVGRRDVSWAWSFGDGATGCARPVGWGVVRLDRADNRRRSEERGRRGVGVRRKQLQQRCVPAGVTRAKGEKPRRPIRCHDTPGFVVNRVLIPLLNDCLRVLDEARVTPEDLDTAMTAGAGWPMGPCTLVDLVGIDVHVHASEALYQKLREPRMAPPPRIVAMRNAGLLGRKSGRGFATIQTRAHIDEAAGNVGNLLLERRAEILHDRREAARGFGPQMHRGRPARGRACRARERSTSRHLPRRR
jgi:hypothetical protein